MNKVKNKVRKDFTVIPNALINDNTLTDRARFLFCYMASKPDNWDFYQVPLAKQLGYSIDTLRKYLKELMESGWVSREERREEGKFDSFDYTLHPSPCGKNTDTVKNRVGEKPHRENSQLYNKDYYKEILTTNKERENAPAKKTDEPLFVTCKNHIIEQLKGQYANILRGARQRSKYSGPVSDIIEDYCRNIAEGQIEGKGDFHLMPPTDEGKHYTWINRMMTGIERYMKHAARREAGNKPTIKAVHTPQPEPSIRRASADFARKIAGI